MAKYFIGFGLQRGIIKMPSGAFDSSAKEYQIFSIDRKTKRPSRVGAGSSRAGALAAFYKAAHDRSQIVVLMNKKGVAYRFSGGRKLEMYLLLVDYFQSSG